MRHDVGAGGLTALLHYPGLFWGERRLDSQCEEVGGDDPMWGGPKMPHRILQCRLSSADGNRISGRLELLVRYSAIVYSVSHHLRKVK